MSRLKARVIFWRGYLLYPKEIAAPEHGEKEEMRKKAKQNEGGRQREKKKSEKGGEERKGHE